MLNDKRNLHGLFPNGVAFSDSSVIVTRPDSVARKWRKRYGLDWYLHGVLASGTGRRFLFGELKPLDQKSITNTPGVQIRTGSFLPMVNRH